MRICSPQLGLAPNSVLGGEVFDREILLGLAKKGAKVGIILPAGKSYDRNINNWHVTHFPISHFPALLANLLYLPYLFFIYENRPFQILRLHQPQFLILPGLFLKLIHKDLKLVATYHQFRESKFSAFGKIINNLWDHIICDSDNVKKKIIENYGVDERKITVVHNGVPGYLKPTRRDQKLIKKLRLDGKIVLLFMGLFIERKNPLFLLDILAKLSTARSDLILMFWGEGPLKSKIIEVAKSLNVYQNIRLIPPVYGPAKNKIHNLADVFVHPSLDEGFALSPLEAMACAKPVIMTRGYSAREAVEDGTNGYLCKLNNPADWAKKLERLISDSKLRVKMGRASLEKVRKKFQWSLSVEKHFKVFRNLVK